MSSMTERREPERHELAITSRQNLKQHDQDTDMSITSPKSDWSGSIKTESQFASPAIPSTAPEPFDEDIAPGDMSIKDPMDIADE